MDQDVLNLMIHIEELRDGLREIVERMPPDDLIELFRECNRGRLPEPDTRIARVVGALAAIALFDICRSCEQQG